MSIKTGNIIKELLSLQGKKQKDLVDTLNQGQGTVAKWLSSNENINRDMPYPILVETAAYLNVSTDFLLSGIENGTKVKQIPIIGTASCGDSEMNYDQDSNKKANYNGEYWNKDLYCVIASGDSMSPEIDDGDEVIIDPNVEPVNGDMVHYKINDESAIKVLVIDTDAYIMQFVPYNQGDFFRTKTIRLDDDEALNELSYHKVVSVNKLKYNNRNARLRLIGRA